MVVLLIVGWWLLLLAYGINEGRPAPEVETVLDPEPENRCEECGIEVEGPWLYCEWCDDYLGPEVPS